MCCSVNIWWRSEKALGLRSSYSLLSPPSPHAKIRPSWINRKQFAELQAVFSWWYWRLVNQFFDSEAWITCSLDCNVLSEDHRVQHCLPAGSTCVILNVFLFSHSNCPFCGCNRGMWSQVGIILCCVFSQRALPGSEKSKWGHYSAPDASQLMDIGANYPHLGELHWDVVASWDMVA